MPINSPEHVVVDIDQSGLIANGKTYEMAQKGYFSKKKNQKIWMNQKSILVKRII